MINQTSAPVLIEVTRGSLVESRHRGMIAVVDAAGARVASLGDTGIPTFFRSAAKPFQAIPLITSGAADRFGLTSKELAVITGSHSGEEIHLATVESILFRGALTVDQLQCGIHPPFDTQAARALRMAGQVPGLLHNNCSGKHAGMLLLAKHGGYALENYLDPHHPIQVAIRRVVAEFTGTAVDEIVVAVDGCSAPVFAVSLSAMALSYARLVASSPETAAGRVQAAMVEFPEMVGGTSRRLDTDLMRVLPGRIISKVGAEGVQLLGILPTDRYPQGLGIAIKIEDGDIRRARDPVVIEVLRQLELLDDSQLAQLSGYTGGELTNHRGLVVGEVRPAFRLGGV